jgi:hypothetical protein
MRAPPSPERMRGDKQSVGARRGVHHTDSVGRSLLQQATSGDLTSDHLGKQGFAP